MTYVSGFYFCLVNILHCELRVENQCEFAVDISGGGKQPGTLTLRASASQSQAGHEGSPGKALPESHGFTIHLLVAARCFV